MDNNGLGKMLNDLLGKVDKNELQQKLNNALEMFRKEKPEELAKKLNSIDKSKLVSKLDEIDKSTLESLNIDIEQLKKKVDGADFGKLSQTIGKNKDDAADKIKDILK